MQVCDARPAWWVLLFPGSARPSGRGGKPGDGDHLVIIVRLVDVHDGEEKLMNSLRVDESWLHVVDKGFNGKVDIVTTPNPGGASIKLSRQKLQPKRIG